MTVRIRKSNSRILKYKTIFIVLYFCLKVDSYGQLNCRNWITQLNNIPASAASIKKNNYKKVYVVETSGIRDVDGFAQVRDTLYVLFFDANGQIIDNHNEKDSSIHEVTVTEKDSIIVEYQLKNIGNHTDTAFILRKVYSMKGELIEQQLSATKFYLNHVDCATGAFHHHKYQYDHLGRLVYHHDKRQSYYRKIDYTDYEKKISKFDFKTNELLDAEHILITRIHDSLNNILTITETNRTTLISRTYRDSLLFLETIIEINSISNLKQFEFNSVLNVFFLLVLSRFYWVFVSLFTIFQKRTPCIYSSFL